MNKELDKYIRKNLQEERNKKNKFKVLFSPIITNHSSKKAIDFLSDEVCDYEKDTISESSIGSGDRDAEIRFEKKAANSLDSGYIRGYSPSTIKEVPDLNNWINENNKYNDFQSLLFKMIDERNLVDADVYNKVHIDRRLFSKIRNDKNYHPSKETIILLGFSLELSEKEIEELLDSAAYSLPRNNHYDLIIRFCFMKGIYKITEVNDLLDRYSCKLFNY